MFHETLKGQLVHHNYTYSSLITCPSPNTNFYKRCVSNKLCLCVYVGKKGSELGEYDPLTQVDSEDDSEEDDLVLNYPRNGLTSHSRTATLRLGQEGAELQEEDEDEGDTWRHGGGKDRRCKAGGVADDSVGLVSEEAGQKAKVQAAVRTAAFVVPLIGAAMFVLLFAFLLPCQRRGSQRQNEWETEVGHAGGVMSPPMALWDVDGDGVEDLLISVMRINNSSQQISYPANIK
ncbi:protein FAM234B, partial [Tachysurus ichikawai]